MNAYLTFKALHLIAVISWMAGLLYLPRIFVYHSENQKTENITTIFKVMEHKLYFYIMTPAMILSWIFGILLIHLNGIENVFTFWLGAKLVLVLILTGYHFLLLNMLVKFKNSENSHSPRFYRILNEAPTILLIAIIFLVIFKPI